jgi:LmeA-like phospholipid-binding
MASWLILPQAFMEILTLLLSSVIGLLSPTGTVADRLATAQIRQFSRADSLTVRIDNAPSYQIVRGKADRVRIASRGFYPVPELRLDRLELETDPIALQGLRAKLAQPLQAGVRLGLTATDLNQALKSPRITQKLRNLGISSLSADQAEQVQRYDLINPEVRFLANGRLKLQAELREQGYPDRLILQAETGIAILAGQRVQLVNPSAQVNGQPIPQPLINAIAMGLRQKFDLHRLEASGVTARVLNWQISDNQLNLVMFAQVRPQTPRQARLYQELAALLNQQGRSAEAEALLGTL